MRLSDEQIAKNRQQAEEIKEELGLTSGHPATESAGPLGALGVVGGSLPAFDGNNLASYWEKMKGEWEIRAQGCYDQNQSNLAAECEARAETFEVCAKELRGHMACATERQPEENIGHEPRAK